MSTTKINYSIRDLEAADIPTLVKLDVEVSNALLPDLEPYDESWIKSITLPSRTSNHHWFCKTAAAVDNDNGPIGFALCKYMLNGCFSRRKNSNSSNLNHRKKRRASYIDLFLLVVDSKHRNHGVGKKLIETVLKKGEAMKDVKSIRLHVLEHNKDAYRLYKRMGFTQMGNIRKNYPAKGYNYYRMVYDLFDK